MKVDMEQAETRTKGTVLRTELFYGPTCLDDESGTVLFVRRYRLIEMPSGKRVWRVARDTRFFPDAEAMGQAIEQEGMREVAALDPNPPLHDVPDEITLALADA